MRVPGVPYVQGRNNYTDTDGRKYAIAIHNTANNATAEGEASYATRRTDGVSAHFYVDNNSVVQSLDTDDRAGHAGSGEGNNHAIAIEITGTNAKSRSWWLANVAWDELGRALAILCKHYGIAVRRASVAEMDLNPRVKAFYGHNDMRLAWGGTTHTDPGPNFPWDRLFQAVNKYMEGDMALFEQKHADAIEYMDGRVEALWAGRETIRDGFPGEGTPVWIVKEVKAQSQKLAALATRVEQLGTAEAARDAAAAARDAELKALLEAHNTGQLSAEAVVQRMGDLLSRV